MENENSFALAKAELQDRKEEREAKLKEIDRGYDYALAVISQQGKDNQDYREKNFKFFRHVLYVGLAVVIVIMVFFAMALYLGFTSFVSETFRTLIVGIFGWLGGYGYAIKKSKQNSSSPEI